MTAWLVTRFGPTAGRAVLWLLVAALAFALLATARCAYDRTARTQVKLARGQATAAVASGSDAVETVGNQQAAEVATDAVTKENDDAIRNAAPPVAVPPALRDAGLASLCRRASYRLDPKCMQRAPAH